MASSNDGQLMAKSSTTDLNSAEGVTGTIRSIVGDIVTLGTASGETVTIVLSKEEIGRYNLIPGMKIVAMEQNGITTIAMATQKADIANSVTASRILAIRSEVVARTETTTTTATETTTPSSLPAIGGGNIEPAPNYPSQPRALW